MRIKIYGAGSAGNHLAFSCQQRGWQVTVVDNHAPSLERMRQEIFPQRYGTWDESITLRTLNDEDDSTYDATLIATPPATHIALATRELQSKTPPQLLLLEKPLCRASDSELPKFLELAHASKTKILVGFNLNFVPATRKILELAKSGAIGRVLRLDVEMRESVQYILGAHWWLKDISESYLGSNAQGGGSLLEHSHAVALWAFLAQELGLGKIEQVNADCTFETTKNGERYDSASSLLVRTSANIAGSIHTDFYTRPALKRAQLIGEKGRLLWWANRAPGVDSVELTRENAPSEIFDFPKKRPDDFAPQAAYLERALTTPVQENSLAFGLHVMDIINTAFASSELRTTRKLEGLDA